MDKHWLYILLLFIAKLVARALLWNEGVSMGLVNAYYYEALKLACRPWHAESLNIHITASYISRPTKSHALGVSLTHSSITSRSHAWCLPALYKSHAFQRVKLKMGVVCWFEHAQFGFNVLDTNLFATLKLYFERHSYHHAPYHTH